MLHNHARLRNSEEAAIALTAYLAARNDSLPFMFLSAFFPIFITVFFAYCCHVFSYKTEMGQLEDKGILFPRLAMATTTM